VNARRVVVTGLGMLTPLGNNVKTTWDAIINGKSGINNIEHFDTSDFACKFAGTLKNFESDQYLSKKEAKKFDPFILYAVAAAQMAIDDAKLDLEKIDLNKTGVLVGSGIGGLSVIEKNYSKLLESGPRKVSPFFIPGTIINMAPGYIAIKHGFKGPNWSAVSACTTGSHNIGEAARAIKLGDADIMLAGGAENASTPLAVAGFISSRALSTNNANPEKASRPWDKDRDGFVLSDGAGVLVLEEYEHAKKRGAHIYAELSGYGLSCDAYHITAPDAHGSGFIKCMSDALNQSGFATEDVDYINAHATSTLLGDILESNAIKSVFKDDAFKLSISSTKSMTGHMLGATGAVEAMFSILAMNNNIIPPTINLDNPSEGCDLDYTANTAKEKNVKVVMSNSFGFGGTNASLIFSKI
tara:strand:- start:25365 stop:26603 length:1239 start_codon:yes stop_codon:yes gene_type:complete